MSFLKTQHSCSLVSVKHLFTTIDVSYYSITPPFPDRITQMLTDNVCLELGINFYLAYHPYTEEKGKGEKAYQKGCEAK
ncbi:MAG: hypothetical protein HXY46_03235 [Syntrophaceae bacterium]|nr:hypothetical protein [Syntrophaceae bacterium]